MNEASGRRRQNEGRPSNSGSAMGLGACLTLLLAFVPGCNDAVASPVGGAASERSEAMVEVLEAATAPTPSVMNMTRHDEPSPAVATEWVPEATERVHESLPAEAAPVDTVDTVETVEPAGVPAAREPIEVRTARQRLTVRIAPDHQAPRRARIPMGESFDVLELVEGTGCAGKGWADVGGGGFVCLARSRRSARAPRTLPDTGDEGVLPFYFAKIPKGKSARRWKSLASYRAGDEPRTVTAPGRDFAFTSRFRDQGQMIFLDQRGRVMPEQDLQRFRPSRFEGHDLQAAPVPEGQRLAWAARWPETNVRTSAVPEAELYDVLDYHAEIHVLPEPMKTAHGTWYALVDGGFVRARDIRRFEAVAPLRDEALASDEIWIDVELDQQVLTVMRGSQAIYATLISSGLKGPTPHGLFRINKKQAYGSMSSAPGAADPYAVEAVPYVQYFHGGIALHSAYWHDRFGSRISHGCVNLSPRDAAYVYSMTSPHPRDGWIEVYEDEGELGTRVRIRDLDEATVDRRGTVEHVYG